MSKDAFGSARSGKSVTTDFFGKNGNNKSRQTTKSDIFDKNNTQTFSTANKQMNDFEKEYQEFLESLKKKKSQDEE